MPAKSRGQQWPRRLPLRTPHLRVAILCLLLSLEAAAQIDPMPKFDSYSDMGGVGLMQMPSARFAPEGEFAFSHARTYPYFRNALSMQPVPWFEGVLRYTTIRDVLYGPANFSGDQTLKDKGIDFKLRLIEESSTFPQVAIGVRDVGGTGLFASEYLVMSRRYYDFDFSLGLAWGQMGTRGQFKNPLGRLFSSFKTRASDVGLGGNLSTTQYFHGENVSLIGGVIYQTPIPGLALKLELDGNNYQSDPSGEPIKAASPINIGLTYSHGDWLDLSMGVERGNTLMAQVAVHGNFHKSTGMPKLDPAPDALKPRELADAVAAMNQIRRDDELGHPELKLASALSDKKFKVNSVEIRGRRATVKVSQNTYRNSARAIGRAARIMANEVPDDVEEFTYVNMEAGLETQRVTLLRKDLEKAVAYQGSPEEMATHLRIEGPQGDDSDRSGERSDRYPSATWSWSPAMKHQIGGPDAAYFYQLFLRVDGELQLTRNLSASAGVIFNIDDNLNKLKLASDSVLPHVRSDIKDYLKQGKTSLSNLQLDYLTNLGRNWYGRGSVGLFEEMFGGVSGELLYRPYGKRWAAGIEVNKVKQRGFDQRFSFRDYEVTTGHLDLYYRLPFYNMSAQVSIGQYLAGDRGFTVGLSRQFDSGAEIGAFATKTNVSAEQFGEGSFDKGFYISLPVDLLSLYSTRSRIGMGWRPLTRDGGQRLSVGKRLYPIVSESNPEKMLSDWSKVLE